MGGSGRPEIPVFDRALIVSAGKNEFNIDGTRSLIADVVGPRVEKAEKVLRLRGQVESIELSGRGVGRSPQCRERCLHAFRKKPGRTIDIG